MYDYSRLPFRLYLLRKLTDVLSAVSKADGYNFDLAGRVFRGRLVYGDRDPIPLVSILEAPLPDASDRTPTGSPHWNGPWELYIQGWVDDDKEHPTDPAHLLMADVRRALGQERRRAMARGSNGRVNTLLDAGGAVGDMSFGGASVRPAEEGVTAYANFALSVTLQITENTDDPYTWPTSH